MIAEYIEHTLILRYPLGVQNRISMHGSTNTYQFIQGQSQRAMCIQTHNSIRGSAPLPVRLPVPRQPLRFISLKINDLLYG